VLRSLADVVLLAVLVRLLSGGGRRPAAYWLLGLSVVALLAADSAFGVITIYGPYLPGSPLDALFIAFPLVCGAAALHPSMAVVATAAPPALPRRPGWRLALLGGVAILAPGVQMVEWLRGQPIEVPVVAAGSIVMFLLIVARTQRLTREVTVQDERRRLLGRVLQAAEDERTRIAHDLHDGPVQQLAVLNYDVYRARKRLADLLGRAGSEAVMGELQSTDEVLEGVEKGLGEETKVLRHLMSALRPPVLDNRGFAEALDEHAQRFEREHATAVDVTLGLDGRLTPELETILYRIVQESLTNVAKHARAGRVSVTVDQLADGTVRLRVRDDGVGFDTGNSARLLREGHFGLAGMRERASLVGGAVEVRSVPGEGTTVEARLPAELLPLEPDQGERRDRQGKLRGSGLQHRAGPAGRGAPDGRRGGRPGGRPHDPDRRPLAGRLRLLQLPGLRPRPRDHRRRPRLPGRLGHPSHPSWSRGIASPAPYPRVEDAVAELLGVEDVLAFPTLTHIHSGVLPALTAGGTLLADRRATRPSTTRP
jgi:signal transduction histidine kinase